MFTENRMLNYQELKEEYPKTMAKLVEWVKEKLERFQAVMLEQIQVDERENVKIPEITLEWAENATGALLRSYHRTLWDFFDENKLFITTDYIFEEGFVVNFPGYKTVEGHLSRIEAEIAGIKAAIKYMEDNSNE
jgi:hypothetical protein